MATDTESLFQENSLRFPEKMQEFQGQTLTYTLNSQAFRAPEFGAVAWSEAVVIFGCSVVFGDGLTDSDCLSSQLSEQLGRPVINLGVSGAGSDVILHNSLVLQQKYPQPWRVITVWPSPDRLGEFTARGVNCYGSWTTGVVAWRDRQLFDRLRGHSDYHSVRRAQQWAKVYQAVNQDPWHMDTRLAMHSLAQRAIWRERDLQLSWCVDTTRITGCELLHWDFQDTGRDLIHPSKRTFRLWAEQIAETLKRS